MATQNVCRYYKIWFCRYSEKCRFPHVKEECENEECEVRSCYLRHLKICSYYRDYRRCKFTVGCRYKHENQSESFEKLKKKIEKLEQNMVDKEITEMERKVKKQQQEIEEKSAQIASLD